MAGDNTSGANAQNKEKVDVLAWGGGVVANVYRNFLRNDGALGRAGRQGIDELSKALQAFPESIQSQESERYPTPREIAAKRKGQQHGVHGKQLTPSEIAKQAREEKQQGNVPGKEHGRDNGIEM